MTDHDDELPLEWAAKPGQEIEVLTEEFCDHFGGCKHCPGIATTAEIGIESGQERTVFCSSICQRALAVSVLVAELTFGFQLISSEIKAVRAGWHLAFLRFSRRCFLAILSERAIPEVASSSRPTAWAA
jgi:hypothetical protein